MTLAFAAVGVPHRERGARVTEAIEVVRTLWRDTPATGCRCFVLSPTCDTSEDRDQLEQIAAEVLPRLRA